MAASVFEKVPASPWLRNYGCPVNTHTYLECLRKLPIKQGLVVEARRAQATLRNMVDIDAISAGPRTLRLELDTRSKHLFNHTVTNLAHWLGASPSDV